MPYVKDGTLRTRLHNGPLSLTEVQVLFTQIAEALQWSHERGIIHRDIKPSNVLLPKESMSTLLILAWRSRLKTNMM